MILEKLNEDLFDKIPEHSKLVIFGAGEVGQRIFKDITREKPNVKIIGFIDNYIKDNSLNLPIWTIKQFIDTEEKIDLVIMSTRTNNSFVCNIFNVYNIPVLVQTEFVSDYYRMNKNILNEENYIEVENIFSEKEDKDLFKILFKARCECQSDEIKAYHLKRYKNTNFLTFVSIKDHYLDKINKEAIKTVLDIGMNSGLNIIAFNKLLPNLEKTYGFEAIYEIARQKYIEDFIKNKKFELVPFAVGNKVFETKFYIDTRSSGGSFCADISNRQIIPGDTRWREIKVNVTTIDKYCFEHNIKPDFIKMDIEGAELSALKGGIETIKKYRPQLAISIYHSDEDFIMIPQYLSKNLINYKFALGHYTPRITETVLYAIPNELA